MSAWRKAMAQAVWILDREIAGAPLPASTWATFKENDPEIAMIYETQAGCYLDALHAMPLPDRLAVARALVPDDPDLAALRAERDALAAEVERIRAGAAHQAEAHTLRTGQKMLADLVRSWGYTNKPQESNGALIRRVLEEQRARVEALQGAIKIAAAVFDRYAELHRAKGTPDATAKSHANAELANQMRAALEPRE